MRRRLFVLGLAAVALQACGDIFGPSTHGDISRAHSDWLANRPASYSFQVTVTSSMLPPRTVSVMVQNGIVTEEIDHGSGARRTSGFLTIDSIWQEILEAVEDGSLHSAKFNDEGVPVSSNMGPWEVDGGRAFEVRGFARL